MILGSLAGCGRAGFDTIVDAGSVDVEDTPADVAMPDGAATDPFVQQGTSMIATGSSSVDIAIDPIDLGHTALFFSISVDSTQAGDALVLGELVDATHVHFERAGATGAVRIAYGITTWSGWTILHGRVTLPAGTTAMAFPTQAFDQTATFAMGSFTVATGSLGPDDRVRFMRGNNQLLVFTSTSNTSAIPIAYLQWWIRLQRGRDDA